MKATEGTVVHRHRGSTIARILLGHRYPVSGNAHNPTPKYRYDVRNHEGALIGSTRKLGDAKALVDEAIVAGEHQEHHAVDKFAYGPATGYPAHTP